VALPFHYLQVKPGRSTLDVSDRRRDTFRPAAASFARQGPSTTEETAEMSAKDPLHNPAAGTPHRVATDIVHHGRNPSEHYGFVNPPVYRGSTVLYPTVAKLESRDQPYTYGRRGTPTVKALEMAITKLEGGTRTVLAPSGYGAVTLALMSFVKSGDHILVTDSVYQPTRKFCDGMLKGLGVETTYYDPLIGAGIAQLFRPNTRLVYVECPGSQTFEMQDIRAIAAAARARDLWVLADNTWASPLYCNPLALGCDVSIQAATKYIVGHADAMLGSVTANARADAALNRGYELMGMCAGSEETYLGLRGIRTLHVRLAHHWQAGVEMARWLESRPEVARVIHPALPSHPGHAIWKRDFTGASGLFAAVLKPCPKSAVAAMLDHLELFGMGFSWGGFESLIVPFDPRSYRSATQWNEPGQALRIHIGLEDLADLKADLEQGFARLRAAL
jgi:cystathionine beta-lyase